MVLSTDNYTEYLLGFWTLHGDVGDFGFIQELWKTEVYALADWMIAKGIGAEILKECVDANPTDGLGVSNSDLDQLFPDWEKRMLPVNGDHKAWIAYKLVDQTLIMQLTDKPIPGALADKPIPGALSIPEVIDRYHATEFKRANPVNIPRDRLI
jgi:NH3-dependent NAD+ synthetase